jgi:anti-anti-sigma factor
VTRIGTQVVVRLSGVVDDRSADRLRAAVDEVAELALQRVVVDLDDVDYLDAAGLEFIARLADRWTLRVLNSPPTVRR